MKFVLLLISLAMAYEGERCMEVWNDGGVIKCKSCKYNYHMNYTNNQCYSCSEYYSHCVECEGEYDRMICSKCSDGYALNNGECVSLLVNFEYSCY